MSCEILNLVVISSEKNWGLQLDVSPEDDQSILIEL